jgi:phosphotransferase system enzyme I (PtsP)
MRPSSVGPVKHLLRRVDLNEVKAIMDEAIAKGDQSVRRAVSDWLVYQV